MNLEDEDFSIVEELSHTKLNRMPGLIWSWATMGPVSLTAHGRPRFVVMTSDLYVRLAGEPLEAPEFPKAEVTRRTGDLWMMASRGPVVLTSHGTPRMIVVGRDLFDSYVDVEEVPQGSTRSPRLLARRRLRPT